MAKKKETKKKTKKVSKEARDTAPSVIWAYISAFLFFVLALWMGYYFFYDERTRIVDTPTEDVIEVNLTDEEIQQDIENQLEWDSRVFSENITASVTDGRVTLVGSVPSYIAKKAAAQSVFDVAGVVSVDNEVIVELPAEEEVPSDQELTDRVENILRWSPDIEAADVEVSVDTGEVTLEGTVDSLWKQTRASELVYGVNGVYNVDNKLAVVYTEDVTDEIIAEDIVEALERNIALDAEDIDVRVTDGEVTLSGKVDSVYESNEAFDVAFFTSGVVSVDNNLEIA